MCVNNGFVFWGVYNDIGGVCSACLRSDILVFPIFYIVFADDLKNSFSHLLRMTILKIQEIMLYFFCIIYNFIKFILETFL